MGFTVQTWNGLAFYAVAAIVTLLTLRHGDRPERLSAAVLAWALVMA